MVIKYSFFWSTINEWCWISFCEFIKWLFSIFNERWARFLLRNPCYNHFVWWFYWQDSYIICFLVCLNWFLPPKLRCICSGVLNTSSPVENEKYIQIKNKSLTIFMVLIKTNIMPVVYRYNVKVVNNFSSNAILWF